MYHAALRCSEVCHTPQASHTLTYQNISLASSKSQTTLTIAMASYKHSDTDPLPLKLSPSGDTTCPIALYRKYASARGSQPGPAFCNADHSPITRPQLANELKFRLRMLGYEEAEYNTHSFRIGKATDMAKDGLSDRQIATAGRWASDAFLQYIRPSSISIP